MDFTAKEIWRVNSLKLNFMGYYVLENIRGQSQALSKTEDIAEIKEIMQMTF